MIRNKPFSSLDTAMTWIEFLAEFKQLPLKLAGAEMTTTAFYNLDLVAVGYVVVFVLLYVLWRLTRLCCGRKEKLE